MAKRKVAPSSEVSIADTADGGDMLDPEVMLAAAANEAMQPTGQPGFQLLGIFDTTSQLWYCAHDQEVFATPIPALARAQLQNVIVRGHSSERWEIRPIE